MASSADVVGRGGAHDAHRHLRDLARLVHCGGTCSPGAPESLRVNREDTTTTIPRYVPATPRPEFQPSFRERGWGGGQARDGWRDCW